MAIHNAISGRGAIRDSRRALDRSQIHIHGLRHTFGSQMAIAGADPFAIMKAMGHVDMQTTMIYVSLGKDYVRDQVEQ